jgi:hypothetical protein
MSQFTFAECYSKNNDQEIVEHRKRTVTRCTFLFAKLMSREKALTSTALDIPELRRKIADLVAKNAISMVQHAIDSVTEDGQYQAIKYLFELVGIYPAIADGEEKSEDTLSQVLLRQLGLGNDDTIDQEPPEHPVK